MARVSIHMVGGGVVELALEAADLSEVGDGLRRERALLGRLCGEEAEALVGSEVLIPSSRIQMLRWC